MLSCSESVKRMHDYLDGDLPVDQHQEFVLHLESCEKCRDRYAQLQKILAVIKYEPEQEAEVSAEPDSCQRIMKSLPRTRLFRRIFSWLRFHPGKVIVSGVALALVSSWVLSWDMDPKLALKIPDEDQVVINGDHVLVPEQTVIHGDVYIEHGVIDVFGEIEGDLIVTQGDFTLADTAKVAGTIYEIEYSYERWMLQMQKLFLH